MLSKLILWFNTVRYLRPGQIFGRIFFIFYRPGLDYSPAPKVRSQIGTWLEPIQREVSLLSPFLFRFLNVERKLNYEGGWDNPSHERLWRYNLHYFDDLNAKNASDRKDWHHDLLVSWVCENPPGKGTGWEPYPVSLRIVNWIKWVQNGNSLPDECIQSLAIQVRWLSRRLEYHLLGNHLLANAKALVFAGLFFEGDEAQVWMKKGIELFEREIPEQILPDGGHFERSPMYHAIILEDMLDLVNLQQAYNQSSPPEWSSIIHKMRLWLVTMCHPNGEITFFNDAAIGISASLLDIEEYALRLHLEPLQEFGDPVVNLPESGYVRVELGDVVTFMDIAPIGPNYLPGHAHADTLSFELSIGVHRVFVNSGTSVYGLGPERLRQRGTAAHNTVLIDDHDSSEVWSGFRVGRRAKLKEAVIESVSNGNVRVCGAHDGYRHLPGSPKHRRIWDVNSKKISITDEVTGEGVHKIEIIFHIHPDLSVISESETSVLITDTKELTLCSLAIEGPGYLEISSSTYHPEFGLSLANQRITYHWSGSLPMQWVTCISESITNRDC
jgi:uncharacterized heparinase superfamily protein